MGCYDIYDCSNEPDIEPNQRASRRECYLTGAEAGAYLYR